MPESSLSGPDNSHAPTPEAQVQTDSQVQAGSSIVPRTLVVTVGTSLFHSVSWRNDGPLQGIRGYGGWLSEKPAKSPQLRSSRGWRVARELTALLAEQPERTLEHFELDDLREPRRYSGEITTLLRCFDGQRGSAKLGLAGYLRCAYPRIRLLAPSDRESLANHAARYLGAVLNQRLDHPDVEVVAHLGGGGAVDVLGELRDYLHGLQQRRGQEAVDLVVTGGFKAFALLIGKTVAVQGKGGRWRALYLHEASHQQLVVEGVDSQGQAYSASGDQRTLSILRPQTLA